MNRDLLNIVIFGANGMLAQDLIELLNYEENCKFRAYTKIECNVTDYTDVYSSIGGASNITNVINCTGYSDINECEKNEEIAFKINDDSVRILSEICKDSQIHFTNISSSYVFEGVKFESYLEQDETVPLTVFGKSKLAGEAHVRGLGDKGLVIRTNFVYGKHKKNLVDKILSKLELGVDVEVFDDQISTPTYAMDLANTIIQLATNFKSGIYHVTNSDQCTLFDFAKKAAEFMDYNQDRIKRKKTDNLLIPKYSVLSMNRLNRTLSEPIRSWENALYQYLIETKRLYEY